MTTEPAVIIPPNPGRLPDPNPEERRRQNSRYPMRPLLPREDIAREVRPRKYKWGFPDRHLNQGSTGTCTGQSVKSHQLSLPVQQSGHFDKPTAFDIYDLACTLDGISANDRANDPGRTYGTTTDASMRAARQFGIFAEWRHAQSMDDGLDWLAFKSPLIAAHDWNPGFSRPNAQGFVYPSGSNDSGHQYLWTGYDLDHAIPHIIAENSWGDHWGLAGSFLIPLEVAEEYIFRRNGDLVAALEVPTIEPDPPPPPPDPQGPWLGTNFQGWDKERGMWWWELELSPKEGWATGGPGPYGETQYGGFDPNRNRFLWRFGIQPRGDWTP